MGAAAFAGFAAHQMLDVPAMMPTIALVALLALVLAVPAMIPVLRDAGSGRWQPALIGRAGLRPDGGGAVERDQLSALT